ncbi:putative ABC transporter [Tuber magnatum]|uniref:Putative ABC transporter n=1 Tax=Tuber magnatum TaxID=42249 RepID=A0A317T3X3_9PEZI|nr:putative ABC transporter [Tuber magnatum]
MAEPGENVDTEKTDPEPQNRLPPSTSSSEETATYNHPNIHNEDVITPETERDVAALARKLTKMSTSPTVVDNPFNSSDPRLQPNSDQFNVKTWVKTLMQIISRDPELYPNRTAGVSFQNLSAHGFGSQQDYQKDVSNLWMEAIDVFRNIVGGGRPGGKTGERKIQILRNFDGLVKSGEMLVVLGRPGSGCTTFLKTIAGETHGFYLDSKSDIEYQGISHELMHHDFRGEAIYNAETDVHFPHLTVGETLSFAAQTRAPRNRLPGVTRKQYAEHMRDVVMAVFGISHTANTKVGNDFVRGVSGGERKRVSIAEAALSGSPLQCWDNSTRGLDSATALEFVKPLRVQSEITGATVLLSMYQASQNSYDCFDKVTVLYEGRQIYFGSTENTKRFFTDMGFHCPERQTTADFLTSLTSPNERQAKSGFENRVPRSPDEFVEAWKKSDEYQKLLHDIAAYKEEFPLHGPQLDAFKKSRAAQQAKRMNVRSPYTISVPMQIKLCIERGFQRLKGDMTNFFSTVFGNFALSLVLGSVFHNLKEDTSSFYSRGALLFFGILMNAFSSALEILTLYAQRPIVEKHSQYALYHPFSEAVASMICDLPSKILTCISFNLTLYFMSNLRREIDAFFIFLLFSFVCTLAMSMVFRTIAAVSRTIYQALAPASLVILMLVIYTGFAIPLRDMAGFMRWLNYIDPIGYAFESLMINEFHDRELPCVGFIPYGPGYEDASGRERSCIIAGAVPGRTTVSGDAYINTAFKYYHSHLWRNLGIMFGIILFFLATYLIATEKISSARSRGEVLVFPRKQLKKWAAHGDSEGCAISGVVAESEASEVPVAIHRQTDIFHWKDVCYDITIKGEDRRILDHVDGWVKPGTLTALMGVSGAGKTTLLDVLANRVTMGVVAGDMFVNGRLHDSSFQRKTGYVQQQDLHLETSTVREALAFSALLRQPNKYTEQEKLDYVEEVIKLLEMEEYAEAVVGVPGEGLNVEQRKRLTIGVELAAKPELLLFLDEPTSGLDSQTAWSICTLMRKLANNGQAILCTIHQPSALLMQNFDRLLFLAKGGKTVYFGPIGENSEILTGYFEKNGSHKCPPGGNPAEWMLEVIGAASDAVATKDWVEVWNKSPEKAEIHTELDRMEHDLGALSRVEGAGIEEFATPFSTQLKVCLLRIFQQYWRTPVYIYSKSFLCISTAAFVGLSFINTDGSIQGLQNQMFSIFMLMMLFGILVQQIMPNFVTQRSLYEARERPSKAYSWKAFLISNIVVELPWQTLMAFLTFVLWYYPIGMHNNAKIAGQLHERGFQMFLLIWAFYMFASTFAHMMIAGIETAEVGSNVSNLLFTLCLIFCGVLAPKDVLPGFWIFMYYISPFTYLTSALLSVGVANAPVVCSPIEIVKVVPPNGSTCGKYLSRFIDSAGGVLYNPESTSECHYCPITNADSFLEQVDADYADHWRNLGLMLVYIAFNLAGAVFIYWLVRVPKKGRKL